MCGRELHAQNSAGWTVLSREPPEQGPWGRKSVPRGLVATVSAWHIMGTLHQWISGHMDVLHHARAGHRGATLDE